LVNKQVVFVGEVNLGRDRAKILERLKSIVGQDLQRVEEKHVAFCQSIILGSKFMIAANEMPVFNYPSGALGARLLHLRFNNSFVGREDVDLSNKLATELPGICNWAITGLRRLQRIGKFTEPEGTKEREQEFRRESSEAFAFLQDCLKVNRRLQGSHLVRV